MVENEIFYYSFYIGSPNSDPSTWIHKDLKQWGYSLEDGLRRYLNVKKLILHGRIWTIQKIEVRIVKKIYSSNYIAFNLIRTYSHNEMLEEIWGNVKAKELTTKEINDFLYQRY